MSVISGFLAVAGCLVILFCGFAFLKVRDVFYSIHLIIISNIYGLSLFLAGLALWDLSLVLIIKIIILILLNIIISLLIVQNILRKLIAKNLISDFGIEDVDL